MSFMCLFERLKETKSFITLLLYLHFFQKMICTPIPRRETVQSDHFLCLEKVSLSLVSTLKDCLTSLRCLPLLRSGWQMLRSVLSFFVTTSESETVLRHQKSVYISVLSLGLSVSSCRNYYSAPLISSHFSTL